MKGTMQALEKVHSICSANKGSLTCMYSCTNGCLGSLWGGGGGSDLIIRNVYMVKILI